MTKQALETAIEKQRNIDVLEREIKELGRTSRLKLRRILYFAKGRKLNQNGFWSSQEVDYDSVILCTPDEIQVLIDYKKSKVEALKKEIENL